MLYDPASRQIACVLIQAGYGFPTELVHHWTDSPWITFPREGLCRVTATRAEWEARAKEDNERAREQRRGA